MKDYSREIKMLCPVCANDQFSSLDGFDDLDIAPDNSKLQCADCGATFTKEELIEKNQHIIDANIEDVKKDLLKDLEKEIKKMFK